ncbi:Sec-independent protein translocase protein TatB [Methylovorus sp. MP688]|uniref:Sec-independent protein translocase protein TatB n=1 Tax=Methylovorus sp. (strain MP688) TaxID=887061 RepID=UPI0001EC43AF|nr:Sec-independent protein translocase protein TatB [Methylovorus sp. MP688]ADQ83479.1 twin-arginine translocation protein, TatB subunit [Methylovorus sp. MP688]
MFDIAFSELLVIGVVALIVIGPEKLPKVARTLGLLAGRLQRYVANVKSDIDRELQFQDLQKLQQEIKQGADRLQADMHQFQSRANEQLKEVEKSMIPPPESSPEAVTPLVQPDTHKPQ